MKTKSKFSLWAYVVVICFIVMSCVLVVMSYSAFLKPKSEIEPIIVVAFFFFIFVLLWLFWGELRTKAVMVYFSDNDVKVKSYMGLAFLQAFKWEELDGYRTCMVPSKVRTYEYLYLIRNGKKVAKISEFYHSNYSELKKTIKTKTEFLGKEDYSYSRDIKEIFEF